MLQQGTKEMEKFAHKEEVPVMIDLVLQVRSIRYMF